jgi:hypothetical protein
MRTRLAFALAVLLFTALAQKADAQGVEPFRSVVLDSVLDPDVSHDIKANDFIKLVAGFHSSPQRLRHTSLRIDKSHSAAESPKANGSAYPNPVRTRLTVPVPGGVGHGARLTVTDAKGTVVAERPVPSSGDPVTVDVAGLAPGTYSYRIASDGKAIAVGNFIKE